MSAVSDQQAAETLAYIRRDNDALPTDAEFTFVEEAAAITDEAFKELTKLPIADTVEGGPYARRQAAKEARGEDVN